MNCLCGHRGFAGPSACVLEKGHEGDHKYGDYQQALAIAAAKELQSLRDQLAAAQQREQELMADNARLRNVVENLWSIIDDIDTYGDMAKSDDKLFRSLVERRQRERWKTGITTDGYKLDIGVPAQSLSRLRNEVLEEAAKVCCWSHDATKIRAMKAPG